MTTIRRMTSDETGPSYDDCPLWEVDMAELFAHALYALDASEVEELANWIERVTGGSNDRSAELLTAIGGPQS